MVFSFLKKDEPKESLIIKIQNSNINNTNWFSLNGVNSLCKCIDVYDGDTVTLVIPFLNNLYKKKCRLKGIDCAEIKTKNIEEKTKGLESKKILEELILNKILYIRCDKEDMYGRTLVDIYLTEEDLENDRNSINNKMIEMNQAYQYDGKTKKLFEDWYKK
jgi:endonuclease YncB( thermonuclease family)